MNNGDLHTKRMMALALLTTSVHVSALGNSNVRIFCAGNLLYLSAVNGPLRPPKSALRKVL